MSGVRTIVLPSRLDKAALPALLAEIASARGADLDLDGAQVDRFGAPALQLLLSAFRTWREDAAKLRILSPSPHLVAAFARLGFAAAPAEQAEFTA